MDDQREITRQPGNGQDTTVAESRIPPASDADPSKKRVDEKDRKDNDRNKKASDDKGDGDGNTNCL